MNIESQKRLKNILHWGGVALLGMSVLVKIVLPFQGVDTSILFPYINYISYIAIVMMVTAFWLHKCERCKKQMYGFVFADKCRECSGSKS